MAERVAYIGEISKQVSERRALTVDWTDRIPDGVTLSSCAIAAYVLPAATSDNSILSSTTGTIDGNTASVFLISGTNNTRYRVSFTATLSDSQQLKEDVMLYVKNIS